MKNLQIKYPNTLKEYRLKHNLTQRQVSAYLKFNSEDIILHWEKGQAMPSVESV